MGIRFQVEQPAPLARVRSPADVDPPVDVMEHDLEPARLAAEPAPGGDVDGVPVLQGRIDLVFGYRHCNPDISPLGTVFPRAGRTETGASGRRSRCCPG